MLGLTAALWCIGIMLATAAAVSYVLGKRLVWLPALAAGSIIFALGLEFAPYTEPGAVTAVLYRDKFLQYKLEAEQKKQEVLDERWANNFTYTTRLDCPKVSVWEKLSPAEQERWHRVQQRKGGLVDGALDMCYHH